MGRKPIDPAIRRFIHTMANDEATTPREELASKIIDRLGDKSPSHEYIIKLISEARNKKTSPLDRKWTTAACSEYPNYFTPNAIKDIAICQETIKKILEVKDTSLIPEERRESMTGFFEMFTDGSFEKEIIKFTGQQGHEMTIRQALWFVRLKPLIDTITSTKEGMDPKQYTVMPWLIALLYAQEEIVQEAVGGKNFDSSKLDELLFSGNLGTLIFTQFTSFLKLPKNEEFYELMAKSPAVKKLFEALEKGIEVHIK